MGLTMKYLKNSLSYLKQSLGILLLFGLFPAVFSIFAGNPFVISRFIAKFAKTEIGTFLNLNGMVFPSDFLNYVLIAIFILIFVLSLSIGFGVVESHLRLGKRNISVKDTINNNFMPVLISTILCVLIWAVLLFVGNCIVFLLQLILAQFGTLPSGILIFLSCVVMLGMLFLFLNVLLVFIVAIPNMLITGYPLFSALSDAFKSIDGKYKSLMIAESLPIFIVLIINIICAFIGSVVFKIVSPICLMFLIAYYLSFCLTTYFEMNNLKRFDSKVKFIYTYKKINKK